MYYKSIICYLFLLKLKVNCLYIDDTCTDNNGDNGVCKYILNCPKALQQLQQQQLPKICGFEGTTSIVCCIDDAISKTSTRVNPISGEVGAKALEKCKEYAKFVYVTVRKPSLVPGDNRTIQRNTCSFNSVKLIVGGVPAKPREFPHMALIGYNNNDSSNGRIYLCGGSLISENFVMSAGHCLSSHQYGPAAYARVGDLDRVSLTDDAMPQELKVIEIVRHPDYKSRSKYNDIALLRLEKNVLFNAYVRPICLNVVEDFNTSAAVASGWGHTENSGFSSDHLLKVTLDMFNWEDCHSFYAPNRHMLKDGINNTSQVCAGSKTLSKDTCQGDSGGPLQIYNDQVYCMYTQIGVTSFGKGCGIENIPGVYTRVSFYIDWIEKTVWP